MILVGNQFRSIGVSLNNQTISPALFLTGWNLTENDVPCNVTHGNYDVAEFAWGASPDPTEIFALYHSRFDPSTGDHSGQNFIRVSIPELDRLLDENNKSLDLLKIRENMARIQEIYVDPANAFPEVALYNWRTVLIKNPAMRNIVNNGTTSTSTWNIEDWWRS
jgi:ABC-type transport system substrate-binding protein